MRFYRQSTLPDAPYWVTPSGLYMLETPHYYELVLPIPGGGFGCYYILARDDSSVWVCCCLLDSFTEFVRAYLSADEVVQAALVQAYRESWPRLYQLLDNGFREDFSDAALTVRPDPDDARGKWFVATVVDNLPALTREHVFDDRSQAALVRVDAVTETALREYRTWSVNKLRFSAKIFRGSVSRDLLATGVFVRDHFEDILDALELVEALGDL